MTLPPRLGLNRQAAGHKSIYFSSDTMTILQEITSRLNREAGMKLSMGKVIEVMIHHCQDKPLRDLLT